MVRCSTPSRTREEDSAEEIEAESNEAEMVHRPKNVTLTIDKRPRTHQGSSVEGGAIMPDQVTKIA